MSLELSLAGSICPTWHKLKCHTLLSTFQNRLQFWRISNLLLQVDTSPHRRRTSTIECHFILENFTVHDCHTLLSTFQNLLQFWRILNPRLHFLTCSPSGINSTVSSSLSVKSSLSVSTSPTSESALSSSSRIPPLPSPLLIESPLLSSFVPPILFLSVPSSPSSSLSSSELSSAECPPSLILSLMSSKSTPESVSPKQLEVAEVDAVSVQLEELEELAPDVGAFFVGPWKIISSDQHISDNSFGWPAGMGRLKQKSWGLSRPSGGRTWPMSPNCLETLLNITFSTLPHFPTGD